MMDDDWRPAAMREACGDVGCSTLFVPGVACASSRWPERREQIEKAWADAVRAIGIRRAKARLHLIVRSEKLP